MICIVVQLKAWYSGANKQTTRKDKAFHSVNGRQKTQMSDLSYKTIFKYAHNAMADLQHFLSLRAPACIEFKIQNVAGKGGFSFLKFVSGLTPIPMRCFENCTKSRKTWLKLVFQVSLECNSVCLLLGKDNRNRKIKLAFVFLIFCREAMGPTC